MDGKHYQKYIPMNKFKKSYGASRDGGKFGNRGPRSSFGGSRDDRHFQKFDAICSNCGKKCQVPFRPDGIKPVYCSDCFGAPRDGMANKGKNFSPRESFSRPAAAPQGGGKSIADLERQIGAMNTKIDTMLKILEMVSAAAELDEAEESDEDFEEMPEPKAPAPEKKSKKKPASRK